MPLESFPCKLKMNWLVERFFGGEMVYKKGCLMVVSGSPKGRR